MLSYEGSSSLCKSGEYIPLPLCPFCISESMLTITKLLGKWRLKDILHSRGAWRQYVLLNWMKNQISRRIRTVLEVKYSYAILCLGVLFDWQWKYLQKIQELLANAFIVFESHQMEAYVRHSCTSWSEALLRKISDEGIRESKDLSACRDSR